MREFPHYVPDKALNSFRFEPICRTQEKTGIDKKRITFCSRVMLCSDVPSNTKRKHSNTGIRKGEIVMSNSNNKSSNKLTVPEARQAMNKFKMEAANDLDVPAPY